MWELSGNPCRTMNAGPLPGKSRTYRLPGSRSTRCSVNARKASGDSIIVSSFVEVTGARSIQARLRGFHGAEECHELFVHQVSSFVVDPVADIVEFQPTHQAG